MIKTISNTTFTLGIIAMLNFFLIALILRVLGTVGSGEVGLIVLGISLIVMINNVIGGSSLVYFTSRESNFSLLVISYLWAIFSTLMMGSILYFFKLIPIEYAGLIILIGFLECLFSIHNQIFIGKENMRNHNFIKLFQKLIQFIIFVFLGVTIYNFVFSLMASYVITLIISFVFTYKNIVDFEIINLRDLFNKALKYGFQIQSSNIVQLLNYRLLYYFIAALMGRSALGLFNIAVQLSEGLWIPSKALSIIQYGKVSNERIEKNKSLLSLRFMKLSFLITIILMILLLIIPNSILVMIFKEGILGVKPVILSLSVGILSIALSLSFSHYLSGRGLYHYLLKGSLIGLIILLISGWILINSYGLVGAGLATSLSYFSSSLYLGNSFLKEANYKLKDLFISRSDISYFLNNIF